MQPCHTHPKTEKGGRSQKELTASMKTFIRIIALALTVMMIAVAAVSCMQVETGEYRYLDSTLDANGRELDDLEQYNLNYMNEEIRILHWSDCSQPEFEQTSLVNDNVRDAIYDRNNNIESRLRVELNFTGEPGNVTNRLGFVRKVQNAHLAGSGTFDILAAYARTIGTLATMGLLVNFGDIPTRESFGTTLTDADKATMNYINTEQPWWPDRMVDTVSFGIESDYNDFSYYFISGDCSTNILYQMICLFFNKNEINRRFNSEARANDLEDGTALLYYYVYNDIWTIDKMISMATEVYQDKNNNNMADAGDFYGLVTVNYMLDAFYTGSNLRFVEKDNESVLKISADYGSRKAVTLVQKLGNWLTTDDCYVNEGTSSIFKAGNSVFFLGTAETGESLGKSKTFDFGILPTPKFDENQLNYYTKTGNPISLYAISIDCPDHFGDPDKIETYSMLTAVIECWCSEGYRLTTPQIFEVNMQLKMSDTNDETQMFEYIRSGITYDLGRFFTYDLSNMTELPDHAMVAGSSWSSTYSRYKNRLNKQIEDLVEFFRTL